MAVTLLQFTFYSILIGFVIDLLVGDPRWFPHPVVGIGKLISLLEKGFRRIFPKTPAGETAGGAFLVICVCIVPAGVPAGLLALCFWLNPYAYLALSSLLCWLALATHSLRKESMKVYKKFREGDTEGARYAVSMIVGRDTSVLDEAGIARAAGGTVAGNTSGGVIAGFLAMALKSSISMAGAVILTGILMVLSLLFSCSMTIPSLIRAYRQRPKPGYDPPKREHPDAAQNANKNSI